jgi:hypothetical protein
VQGVSTKELHYFYGGDGLAAILKRLNGTDTISLVLPQIESFMKKQEREQRWEEMLLFSGGPGLS